MCIFVLKLKNIFNQFSNYKMKKDILRLLFDHGAIKKGDFTFKSGIKSDLYCDMRHLYSFPKTLKLVSAELLKLCNRNSYDLICGVPLGAIPYATAMSIESNIPLIALRPERKEHGLEKLIEGNYKQGQRVLLVEDVTTTGNSINESAKRLEEAGLKVVKKVVIIDRRSSENRNDIVSLLTIDEIREYSKKRRFRNSMSQRLWDIVQEKQTNICLSVDLDRLYNIVELLEDVGEHICMVKLHWDTIDYDPNLSRDLYKLSEHHNFLILDDRKYNDIDSIVKKQNIRSHISDFVTLIPLFGQGTIDGIKNSNIFLVAQSSAKGNLIDTNYTNKAIELAKENPEKVSGLITQDRTDKSMLNLTPGINLDRISSGKQGYKTPHQAVMQGSDILIVGRGIYNAEDPVKECIRYKTEGWKALQERNMLNETEN